MLPEMGALTPSKGRNVELTKEASLSVLETSEAGREDIADQRSMPECEEWIQGLAIAMYGRDG